MTKLEQWAETTQKRQIVLQVVRPPGDPERWRAEAIHESGSTTGLECAETPERALALLVAAFDAMPGIRK